MHKSGPANSSWCNNRRQIDDADSDTPVAVNSCATNCLDESVLSVMYISSRVDIIIRDALSELSNCRRSAASKLASLYWFYVAHKLLLHD